MMIEIPLTRGYVAIVDDDCPPEILTKKWCARVARNGNVYAVRSAPWENGRRVKEQLHRAIMNPADGLQVDHIDGNGLNNQRSNLRVCTHAENARNRRLNKRTTTGLKGVYQRRGSDKWQARIRVDGRFLCLGQFGSKLEAAKAYDEAAVRMRGEFARTNASLGLL